MKKLALALALVGLVALSGQARAVICTIDDVPAATLLLPYFEVDLGDTVDGINTLFSINNASATAILAHVVVWTDLSVPVLDFNVYLTGFDVQTISLREIIANGIMPRTASVGQDPSDTISPQGAFSQDINFASCQGFLPPPNLPANFLSGHLQPALTGHASTFILGGRCAGRDLGDNIARGYVTVDTVNNCTLRFPGDPGYFAPFGFGDATNQNVLWGDYFYVNTGQNFAQGETLVHIEASPGTGVGPFDTYPLPGSPSTTVNGDYTFYGRYDSWNAVDNREPLATNFAGRFVNGGAFDGGTSWICWRDSKINQQPFNCGTTPTWYPLGQEQTVIFDEIENPEVPQTFPFSPQPPNSLNLLCPAEAQRTVIGGADFPVTPSFGWIFADLNTTVAGSGGPADSAAAQAWVTVVMDAQGRFSVGFDAIQLDSACAASHIGIAN